MINGCYGGFGISSKALMLLIKKKSKCVKKVSVEEWYGNNWQNEFENDFKNAKKLEEGFYEFSYNLVTDKKFVYRLNDIKRDDEDLIRVVEKLGQGADGKLAELKVVKIP